MPAELIGEILPLGLAIGLSPFPLIATVLLLLSERAHLSGPLFLVGWVAGTIIAVTSFTLLSAALERSDPSDQGWFEGVGQIVIGTVLLVLAARKWQKFLTGTAAELPGWMASITAASPGRSLALGLGLSTVNPKNLLVAAAAGLTLGSAYLETSAVLIGIGSYTLLASVTVILPVLVHGLWPARSTNALRALESWLTANSTALMALLLTIFGVVVLGNGIGALQPT